MLSGFNVKKAFLIMMEGFFNIVFARKHQTVRYAHF